MIDISKEVANLLYNKKKEDTIEPFFHPIINNEDLKIDRYEVLVRLVDKINNKFYTPYHFLDHLCQDDKNYIDMVEIIILKAFFIAKKYNINISINLFLNDLLNDNLVSFILDQINFFALDYKQITIELLEKEINLNSDEEIEKIKKQLNFLQKCNIAIALDDFGHGSSNYTRIMNFSPDIIKLDGGLIKDIDTNKKKEIIVKTIVAMAKEFKLKIVAEFVENNSIFNMVKSLKIDYSQGYYFYEPLSEEKLSELNNG